MSVRVVVFLMLMLLPSAVQAEKRMALLIGNQSYSSTIGALANPHNDVALLETSLKGLGFDVVTVRDAGLASLHQAVNAYARRVQAAGPNAVAFFYYSGHGAADAGTNYLIPVDVKTTETGELWDQSMQLTEITRKLKRRHTLRGVRCLPQHAQADTARLTGRHPIQGLRARRARERHADRVRDGRRGAGL